jgi:hypothetical protein
MAGLDPRYVLAPSLQMYFVDKDTGLPMVNGQVFFYIDGTNIPKPVYEISGTPPNFSYTVLPNPVLLSAVGTFQDASGNDILPYYFPYDANGNVQLYTVMVFNDNGVLQFTREGWPNFTVASITENADVTNFIPNGQFLLHNNIPASSANSFVVNKVSQPVTVIGQGGWTFERNSGSTAMDFVSFPEYSSITSPTGNPRYAVNIQTTLAGSDTRKDLCVKFPGVNTFASTTLSYNFYFEAQAIVGGSIPVEIIVRKFFGTGGSPSPTSETVIGSVTLSASVASFNTPILFGINTGQTLGTNNDDYVQIVVRLPPAGVQQALFTNFALTINPEILTAFPTQTEAEQLDESTAGFLPVPDPNGFNLYLPIILTATGFSYDSSQIGEIVQNMDMVSTSIHPTTNLLRCDGGQYLTKDYSPLGIPYKRLQQFLFNNGDSTSINIPIFGTGPFYSTAYISAGATNQIMLSTNKAGLQTIVTDGASATGFTFGPQIIAGQASILFASGANSLNTVTAYSTQSASAMVADANAGTSTFTVTDINSPSIAGYIYAFDIITAAASGLAGLYFTFGNTTTAFYMWFTVNGSGADPAPGGTGIKVALKSTMTAQDVAICVANAMAAQQVDLITITAAPSAGSYFTFNANSLEYVVWYTVNGAGAQPVVGGASQYIQVAILSTDTNAQITTKTQIAINSLYFAVPDLQGMFLRGIDNPLAPKWDIDLPGRFGYAYTLNPQNVGSFEIDQYTKHVHSIALTETGTTNATVSSGGGITRTAASTNTSGQTETRPVNAYVNFSIRY